METMRNGTELMKLFLDYANEDGRVRLVTLEGSRTNINIPRDRFQDYDISYFVTDMKSFQQDDHWLDYFGTRLMLQKPEAMELFPPELGNWFSYLILFEDGNKLDLTLIPIEETEDYFTNSDGLVEVLLDKDGLADREMIPSDRQYWIKSPAAGQFDDCCNEFWMASTYVVKGLAREEILFAIDHLQEIVRPNLLRMMAWLIGAEQGYNFSLGKNYKFIARYIEEEDWNGLMSTYRMDGLQYVWDGLFTCYTLFRKYSSRVAKHFSYVYPEYDQAISRYTDHIFRSILN